MAQDKYKLRQNDVFSAFEPYWCGIGTPVADKFKPLNNLDVSETLKFQLYDYRNNPFEVRASEGYYKINNSPIIGVRQGTCPKAGNYLGVLNLSSTDVNPVRYYSSNIRISKTQTEILIDHMTDDFSSVHYTEHLTAETFRTRKLKSVPSRLGIALVGGGGGAGGASWTDVAKHGDKDDYSCPGSGGGGAATIWLIIDLDYARSDLGKYFWVKVGKGGQPGKNAKRRGVDDSTNFGDDGQDGGPTWIGYGKTLSDAESWWVTSCSGLQNGKIASANGGKGGKKGKWSTDIPGGMRGDAAYTTSSCSFAYLKGKQNGKDGCGITVSQDSSEEMPSSEAQQFEISFLLDETGAAKTFTTIINNPAHESCVKSGKYEAEKHDVVTSGGNSYGNGAHWNKTQRLIIHAGPGGGGANYVTTDDHDKEETGYLEGVGGDGLVMLFY